MSSSAQGPRRRIAQVLARPLIAMVRFYQNAISPLFLPRCRYFPTCSAYALEALQVHGAVRGSWLAARRLGRCHPWTPGGVDHVPPRRGAEAEGSDRGTHEAGVTVHPVGAVAGNDRRDDQPVTCTDAGHHRD